MLSDYQKTFIPCDYLRTYYSDSKLSEDEILNSRTLIDLLKRSGKIWHRVLEIGCGPTIHHAIPLTNYAEEIHLSDYLAENLDQVQLWLENSDQSHNWNSYIRELLLLEDLPHTADDIDFRAAQFRSKVTGLHPIDLLQDQPLGNTKPFDLVTMFYTAECAARNKEEWFLIMHRVAELVAPGGTLFQVSMRNCSNYVVGSIDIATTPVNENDMHSFLAKSTFNTASARITPIPVPTWASHGFNSIVISHMEK